MNILKNFWLFMLISMIALSVSSCSKNDDGGSGGPGGGDWFVSSLNISFHEDDPYVLDRINELFDSSGRYGGTIYLPNGKITNGPAGSNSDIEVTHIINNTVEAYYAFLYKYDSPGTQGKTLLYRITGTALGDVAYYITSPIKTFTCSRDGNVITYTIDGRSESFTITSNELKGKDGFAMPRVSFGKTYTDNFKPVDKSELIADAKTITKTATVVGTPTFHTATFKCTFGTSTKGEKYTRVFAFSKNRADLENAEQLGSKYYKQTGVKEVHNPPIYTSNLNTILGQGPNGYLEDGDLRLVDEQIGDLSNFTVAYNELGVTVYYCPVIIVANDVAVIGDINSVTMRQLKQTSGFVDLGLSCQWQATNNKASTPWDFGSPIALYDKNVSGEGRIPTKEEVLELNKCKLEAIDNGILVTGLNGNELFIPYRDINQKKLDGGYGTTSSQYKDLFDRDVLWNFDYSQGKFSTYASSSLSRHGSAYVRPVKSGGGGGGNSGDTSDYTYISLSNLLKNPMGDSSLDLATTSISVMADKLAKNYTLSDVSLGEWWSSFTISLQNNPDCSNIHLADIMCLSFINLYVSGSPGSFSSTSYNFIVNKSDYPDIPSSMFYDMVKSAYSKIGIQLIEETYQPLGIGECYCFKGNETYRVTMYDDIHCWNFELFTLISF
jgi:hypothetical protein